MQTNDTGMKSWI